MLVLSFVTLQKLNLENGHISCINRATSLTYLAKATIIVVKGLG